MEEIELQDHRRKRLNQWLKNHGGATNALRARGLDEKAVRSKASRLSQVQKGGKNGGIAGRAARNWEKLLGMDPGHLDDLTGGMAGVSPLALELAMLFDELLPSGRELRADAFKAASDTIRRFRDKGAGGDGHQSGGTNWPPSPGGWSGEERRGKPH